MSRSIVSLIVIALCLTVVVSQCPAQGKAPADDPVEKLKSSYDVIWNQAKHDGLTDFMNHVGVPKTWDRLSATELQKWQIKIAQLKYASKPRSSRTCSKSRRSPATPNQRLPERRAEEDLQEPEAGLLTSVGRCARRWHCVKPLQTPRRRLFRR